MPLQIRPPWKNPGYIRLFKWQHGPNGGHLDPRSRHMKTWTKALIATGVIAVHALGFAATSQPRNETPRSGLLAMQAAETEWLLPEVVVTADSGRPPKERGGRHAARHGSGCRFHCDDGGEALRTPAHRT